MNPLEATEICGVTPLLYGNLYKAYCKLAELGCPVFVRMGDREQHFFIDAESDKEGWADFYSSDPFENPRLERELKPLGLNWDWESPGCIVVFND